MSKLQAYEEAEEARKLLMKYLKPGDTVFLVLESASRSGMSRAIVPYAFYVDTERFESPKIQDQYLGGWTCKLLGLRSSKRNGVIMNGAGMDMGFKLVYELAVKLFGKGDALK